MAPGSGSWSLREDEPVVGQTNAACVGVAPRRTASGLRARDAVGAGAVGADTVGVVGLWFERLGSTTCCPRGELCSLEVGAGVQAVCRVASPQNGPYSVLPSLPCSNALPSLFPAVVHPAWAA